MCGTRLAGNTGSKNDAKNHHLCTIAQICRAVSSQLRHVSTIRKKFVKQKYVLHMSSQYGKLLPINGWDLLASLGHPSKFQPVSRLAFVAAVTSLTNGHTSCKVYTMFGRLLGCYTICTFSGALVPWQNFARCKIHSTSKSCVFLHWQRYYTALQQPASAKLCGVEQGMEFHNFRRGRHLYSAGRPSRWASVHIVVLDRLSYSSTFCRDLLECLQNILTYWRSSSCLVMIWNLI